jgi:hypothetical protein
VLVFVFRIARRAPRLLDVGPNHGDHRVIRDPPFTRTVIIQDVTKPKLALLHQALPNGTSMAGKGIAKGAVILAELTLGGNRVAATGSRRCRVALSVGGNRRFRPTR